MYGPRALNRRSTQAALLATPALALALAACSGAPSPIGTPSGSSASGSVAGGSGAASGPMPNAEDSAARDAYDLRLARCIRGKGVDVADPRPGAGISEDGPEVRAAASECAAELPPPPLLTPAEEKQVRETYLTMAACLRALGYDVTDPPPDQAIALTSDIRQSDVEACESTP